MDREWVSEEASPPAPRGARRLSPRLFEKVAEALRTQISSGAIGIGTVLRESSIAERFNVSRAPVRMALEALDREGILASENGVRRVKARPAQPAPVLPPEQQVIAPELAWERIYGDVETALVARMAFGTWRLIESDLAREFDVSRTVAREVLGRLQQRGIVKKDQRAHWYVPGLGPEYVSELYEMRWTLEPVALLNAAGKLPPGLPRACLQNVENAAANAAGIDGALLDSLEEELHCSILDHCDNATMMEAVKMCQSLLTAHRYLYRAAPQVYETEPFLPEHRRVLAALVRGDPAEAAKQLEHHLRASRERAIYRINYVRKVVVPIHCHT